MNIDKVVSFVRERGSAIEHARTASILWNAPVPDLVLEELAAMQYADGGYSYWIPGVSSVCDTAYVLQWLDDLGLHGSPVARAACRYLLDRQLSDGGWDEDESIAGHDPPEWLIPGRIETRIWLTGFVSHLLVRFEHAEAPGSNCPAYFLLAHCDRYGRLVGYERATWLALPILAVYPGINSEPYRRTLAVAAAFPSKDWKAGYLGWMLRCLSDAHVPADHPLVVRSLDDLEQRQRPDGGWDPEEGEGNGHTVDSTITVLRAFHQFGRI